MTQVAATARQPAWFDLLDSVITDINDIEVLRRWMAFHLVPDFRPIDRFVMLCGPARSGKSTIGYVLSCLVGHDRMWRTSFGELTHTFMTASMRGAFSIFLEDASSVPYIGREVDRVSEVLKALCSGGSLLVQPPFEEPRIEVLSCRVTAACSALPHWISANEGLALRCVPIHLRSVQGKETPDFRRRIAAEIEFIRKWALEGVKDLAAVDDIVRK